MHDVGVVCLCAMCDSYFLVIVSQVVLRRGAPCDEMRYGASRQRPPCALQQVRVQ